MCCRLRVGDLQGMRAGRARGVSGPTMRRFIPLRVNLVVSGRLIVADCGGNHDLLVATCWTALLFV